MAVHEHRLRPAHAIHPLPVDRSQLREPGYQAFLLLRSVVTVAPVLFGLDEVTNLLTFRPHHLAHWIDAIVPGTAQQDMYAVGVVAVVAAVALGRLAVRYAPGRRV